MTVALLGAIALAGLGVLVIIAVFSAGLGQKTCRECGGGLPVVRTLEPSMNSGDWKCPRCGTRFNPHGQARDQLPR
jgi:hypothetical protein